MAGAHFHASRIVHILSLIVGPLLLTPTTARAGWPPLLRGAQLYDSGSWPTSAVNRQTDPAGLAAADLNGDGFTDLVTADFTSGTVTVLLHSGDSGVPPLFQPKVTYPCPGGPLSMELADMNQDGRQDVVAYTFVNTVLVLLSTGPGIFGPAVSYSVPATVDPGHRIAATDVNGDNWPDVILPFNGDTDQGIAVLLGTGNGNLGACTTYDFGTVNEYFVALVAGDVTGDGVVDLVLARRGIGPVILAGNNDGTFSFHSSPVVVENGVNDVAVADLNFDNKLDIVVGGNQGTPPGTPGVSILIATGSGNFQPYVHHSLPAEPGSLALGDVTGDQVADIVAGVMLTGESRRPVAILPGQGNGTFLAPTFQPMSPWLGNLVLADVNGNGRLDIIAPNGPSIALLHTVTALLDDGAGGFLSAPWSLFDRRPFRQAIGDFNRDGKPDVAYTDSASVRVGVGNGTGTFVDIGGPATAVSPGTVLATDLNRDAKPDMVVQSGTTVVRHLGAGDGTFTLGGSTGSSLLYHRSMLDINRDGRVDMVLRVSLLASMLRVMLQQSDGTFIQNNTHTASGAVYAVAHGDWNRDGTVELAYAMSNGIAIVPWTGTGLGSAVNVTTGRTYMDLCSGDFNRDGKLDVAGLDSLAGQSGTRGIDVFLGDGAGGFGPALSEPTLEQNGVRLEAWDANLDGIPDLVASGLSDWDFDPTFRAASAEIHLGTGSGTFGLRTAHSLGGITGGQEAPYFVAGDVSGDDLPDVLASNRQGMQALLSMHPDLGNALGPRADYVMRAFLKDVAVGDLNRDGVLDVVAITETNAPVVTRLGTGDGTFGPASDVTGSVGGWRVDLADVNRDGILDLVTARNTPPEAVSCMLGVGDGTFGPRLDHPITAVSEFEIADLNRDGILDFVVGGQGNPQTIRVLLGDGDGTFTEVPTGGSIPLVLDLEIVDVNRDGKLDVVATDNNLYVLYGNGDGTLANSVQVPFGSSSLQRIAVADFDRDGFMDVATADAAFRLFVAWGSANPPFSDYDTFITPHEAPWDLQIGSAEADGRPFVYMTSLFTNMLTLFEPVWSGGNLSFTPVGTYDTPDEPNALELADLNRDGRLDVVTANNTPGNVSVFLESTGTVTGIAIVPAATPRARLDQNAPNPFNPETTIRFAVPKAEPVQLCVYDVQGRMVAKLMDGPAPAGEHSVRWNGRSVSGAPAASGVYYYRLRTIDGDLSRRMVLVK